MLSCVHKYENYARSESRSSRVPENLTSFLESGSPVAITRHGETVGYYIPTRKKPKAADITAMKTAAAQLQAWISDAGATEEQLVTEFKALRRHGRQTSR